MRLVNEDTLILSRDLDFRMRVSIVSSLLLSCSSRFYDGRILAIPEFYQSVLRIDACWVYSLSTGSTSPQNHLLSAVVQLLASQLRGIAERADLMEPENYDVEVQGCEERWYRSA
ncbi:hypothetical protein GLAREA_11667 [Glarea lozoyensis ATCC 20868]|uniref:Uncharacterized protein n=1 Tax=Glarea lozoyensis (strain ATCC 20868 / MF5171) TaxID=1116229 RepID=S3CZ18_GLAL2|nr:uncharacterized protein GLAREA_11667 [Glarea lozoyensis ATCC 20868]EPE25086.1 hypothetical protein GLAREA_11667 [Glarea lozoyensis ATCC 20868]